MTDLSRLSRREIVRIAAGGFALAASGLYLPNDPRDVEAREGALAGARGGRHGKNHRGRDTRKRRDPGEQKDKGNDRPPQSARRSDDDVSITFYNFNASLARVQGWQSQVLGSIPRGGWSIGPGWEWSTIDGVQTGRNFKDFNGTKPALAVETGNGFVVHVWKEGIESPWVRILKRGGVDTRGPYGTELLHERKLRSGISLEVLEGIRVREGDGSSSSHVRIVVEANLPS